MSSAMRFAIFSLCVLGTCFHRTASFRIKMKAGVKTRSKEQVNMHDSSDRSELLSPGSKVLVVLDGIIDLGNKPHWKDSGKYSFYATMSEAGVQGWVHDIDPASISVRGSAVWDPINVKVGGQQPVTARLPGTILKVEKGLVTFKPDSGDEMELPFDVVHPLQGQHGLDYKVTEVIKAGATVFNGNEALFYPIKSLGEAATFKEFVLKETVSVGASSVNVEIPFYVAGEGHCGVELFTTPGLTCEIHDSLKDDLAIADRFAPKNDRGFGLEFELVSRHVPGVIEAAAIENLNKNGLPSQVENYTADHAQNYPDPSEYAEVVKGVQYVNYCFRKSIKTSPRKNVNSACTKHYECNLGEFCTTDKVCKPRKLCDKKPIDGVCPLELKNWNWETDVSVQLLTDDEVAEMGADANEKKGVGMELVAPGPPNVLSGLQGIRSAAEVLGILSRQGVQAGPSQGLHLHVNVLSSASPGVKVGLKGIASIWAAWAKYQLPLDEMLSPSRPDNTWSGRLFFGAGSPWNKAAPDDCRTNPEACTAIFFRNMHAYLKANPGEHLNDPKDALPFCNAMFGLPGDPEPCNERYPHQRYSQVNLMPLTRYGTVEFRPHSATTKIERVARWVQFLTSFVEYFGNTREGLRSTADFFDGEMSQDFGQLRAAQRSASLSQLFAELGDKVDGSSLAYFQERKWETGDKLCDLQKADLKSNPSFLELKNKFEAKKAASKAKSPPVTPVEIMVPVPQDDEYLW